VACCCLHWNCPEGGCKEELMSPVCPAIQDGCSIDVVLDYLKIC